MNRLCVQRTSERPVCIRLAECICCLCRLDRLLCLCVIYLEEQIAFIDYISFFKICLKNLSACLCYYRNRISRSNRTDKFSGIYDCLSHRSLFLDQQILIFCQFFFLTAAAEYNTHNTQQADYFSLLSYHHNSPHPKILLLKNKLWSITQHHVVH